MTLARVEDLVAAIARGQIVILVDSPDRENEGDFVAAASLIEPATVQFMAAQGRGLICAPVLPDIANRLDLSPMAPATADPKDCAFTISVDAREGITTGISAFDRARTLKMLADSHTRPDEFKRPGHIFPLRARAGGVLERPGHTEAAIDLARLAGLPGAAVICEILNDDGTMARYPDLEKLAARHGLLLGSIADLIEYRKRAPGRLALPASTASNLHLASSARMPTPMGVFRAHVFSNPRKQELVVLTLGDLADMKRRRDPVMLRVHSACFTGDVLGSLRCDCGGQLQMAMKRIGDDGVGMLIYLPQEGRGIGLGPKLDAYRLQDEGLDTVEANLRLGFPADPRTYEDAVAVLEWFGVKRVRLLTNNPAKVQGLSLAGIEVVERLQIEPGPGPVNHAYLRTKKGKLGHFFDAI